MTTEWQAQALCRGATPSLFYDDEEAARLICAECPVSLACLLYAVGLGIEDGVWGGSTGAERKEMVGWASKVEPEPDPRCGTEAGWCVHQRRKTKPCMPCVLAHRRERLWYEQRRRMRRDGELVTA